MSFSTVIVFEPLALIGGVRWDIMSFQIMFHREQGHYLTIKLRLR